MSSRRVERMADRRAFLARLGAVATAPVVTAYAASTSTGLLVPDRHLETEPAPMVISSLTGPPPGFEPGQRIAAPHGALVFYIDGEPWQVLAYRLGG